MNEQNNMVRGSFSGKIKSLIKSFIPAPLFKLFEPAYHYFLALVASLIYGLPSRKLIVIGVTGTTGKTTVVELIRHIFNKNGILTASASSLNFCIGEDCEKNDLKMTMPGRFRLQKFIKKALLRGATHIVIEVTSQGVLQSRNCGINFDYAVFTNIAPEHIEAHGGFEKYRNAKLEFFRHTSAGRSKKIKGYAVKKRAIVNGDDPSFELFLDFPFDIKKTFSVKNFPYYNPMSGDFNKANVSAAAKVAEEEGLGLYKINEALHSFSGVPGRMEFIQKEPFLVVVDYAHTPGGLQRVYEAVSGEEHKINKMICVLGAAGGGRDKWKRPEMGRIAAQSCDEVILTNEDPYDEDPAKILGDIAGGFSLTSNKQFIVPKKIISREEAIRRAIALAEKGDVVVITGKGAEPWIMGPKGTKTPWDDRAVVKKELEKIKK